jgi:quercetin dioxygenase-like cupin family protein
MPQDVLQDQTRRTFLKAAPLAAAAVIANPLSETALTAQTTPPPQPFKLFAASQIADAMKQLQAQPGNDNLYASPALPFTIVLTTEDKKSAKDFEYHEGRDHILQVLEGSTLYQVGGTPEDPHNTKPGEWLAPSSKGATSCTLHKGDMLVIPRGTPHKRSTADSVTFYLISTTGDATA